MRKLLSPVATLALTFACSMAVAAPATLIYINNGAGDIYSYDPGNSYAETLVKTGTGAFSISSGPLGSTLYLQSGGQLKTLDLGTNAISTVGGSVPGNALGEGRDGFIYAGSGMDLYKVDPTTGVSTLIGAGANGYAGDIAVDPTDVAKMYGAVSTGLGTQLALVDKATGLQSLIGAFGNTISGDIWGLGFALDGTLYAAGSGGFIYTVDKTTGAATSVYNLGYAAFDMATQPFDRPENQVPEPGSLALMAAALLGLAGLHRTRQQRGLRHTA